MIRATWEAMTAMQRRAHADPNRKCIELGCDEPAGTPWGRHWCADHDDERIHRISAQLQTIRKELR